ncbi:hypothetical protein GCM10020358_49580 [Amorphoplanes nipponensis]|uniref:Helix-turn-helix domain-containing protein n=2 Tax=Actinoplanes nipponensis TaxID=135950 RepID=A0A919JPK0_9ACTN|nr:hypothetical protein Ani05nite_66510 [Actinoplanes nipponensis]
MMGGARKRPAHHVARSGRNSRRQSRTTARVALVVVRLIKEQSSLLVPNDHGKCGWGSATSGRGTRMPRRTWTVAQVRELGMATDIETAASVLGIGRTTAYTLARSGDFPTPVIRVGRRYVVAVEGLLTVLGAT